MKTGAQIGLLLAAGVLCTVCARGVDTIALPRLPAMGPKSATVISQVEIRGQLRAFLPKSELVLTETRAQAGRVGDDADALGEPQTVAARIGIHPVIDLADANYSVVPYEYLPVLVDWFEELARSMGYELRETRAAGFRTNKVARLMRVFLSSHLSRAHSVEVVIAKRRTVWRR